MLAAVLAGLVGSASVLFFLVLLAHIELRQQFTGDGVVYLEQFYFTIYIAILTVTINVYFFTTGKSGRLRRLIHYPDNLVAKVLLWPSILSILAFITLGYFGGGPPGLK